MVPATIEAFALHTHLYASFRFEQVESDVAQDGEVVGLVDIADMAEAPDTKPLPKFRSTEEQIAFELCKSIEGLPRHMGMHCAGVVISPGSLPLADLVPLQRASRDPTMAITQYDKDAIEHLGLVE